MGHEGAKDGLGQMASDGLALRAGRAVRIDGLQKRADLNGRKGRVVRQEGERWVGACPRRPPRCASVPAPKAQRACARPRAC